MSIKLIVGLGNPGIEYKFQRHNAGFWFANALAKKLNIDFKKNSKFSGELAQFSFKEEKIFILKPETFINKSGIAVKKCINYFNISSKKIIIAHDELDLSPGLAKIKTQGGHAGHNGLRDITKTLETEDFYRLRIGIGRPDEKTKHISNFVLSKPNKQEQELINKAINNALDIIDLILKCQIEKAMNKLHTKEI